MSVYTAPSQIAQRQLSYFADKHVLVAGEVEDDFPVELRQHCQAVTVFTTHYGYYRQLLTQPSIQCYFGEQLDAPIDANMILLYWPKAKAEAEFLLAMLMAKLGPDTEICVVGENRSGVKSIEKIFAPYGIIKKYDSARRCSFYWGKSQYAAAPFNITDWFKTYSVDVDGQPLIVKSLPGVFSHGQLDIGSQLLLHNLPHLSGKVLDFGCGAGVLGAVMASRYPDIQLEMCDISALAVASSKATFEANGFLTGTGVNVQIFASDVYSDTTSHYRFIISNPPFHSGLDTNYNATETLLAKAPEQLVKEGRLLIVANSFLKYSEIIENAFGHCNVQDKSSKFTIYQAQK